MTNEIIRTHAKEKGVPHYKIAKAMGMSEFLFSRLLRDELEKDVQDQIIHLINRIAADQSKVDASKVNQKSSEIMRKALNGCISSVNDDEIEKKEKKKRATKRNDPPQTDDDWFTMDFGTQQQ